MKNRIRVLAVVVVLLFIGVYGAVKADFSISRSTAPAQAPDAVENIAPFLDPALTKSIERATVKIVSGENGDGEREGMPTYAFSAPMRVGIITEAQLVDRGEMVRSTLEQLYHTFGRDNVEVLSYGKKDLQEELQSGRLDFVLADSAFYSEMEALAGLKGLASLWSTETSDPQESIGAVYFTRTDTDILTVEQMKGRPVAATSPVSFEGTLVPRRDLLQRGLVPNVLLKGVVYYGINPLNVVEAVLERKTADVGILPACALEHLASERGIHPDNLRYLGLRKGGPLMCARSTELYPSWYFAVTPGTDPQLTKAVSASLYVMPGFGKGSDWGFPVSNRAVHDLFFDLKIGPYEHLARWSFERFVREQTSFFFALVLGVVFILCYAFLVSVMVRLRTRQLREAMADRSRIEKQAAASRDHIANLERTGIVGQMSTMIAHELKQPLGAITNFANGLLRRAKRGALDPQMLTEVLEEIVEQGTRASEIVNRVRAYAKHQNPELKVSDMSICIERAIETFRRSKRTDAPIRKAVHPYLWAEIDNWEIELALLNLLKNAADALEGRPDAEITVRVYAEDKYWRIEVKDNGALITQHDVDKFMQPLVTSKSTGLGLGLSIIGSIAERHHGRLVATPNPKGGMTFALDIPRAEMPEHTAM